MRESLPWIVTKARQNAHLLAPQSGSLYRTRCGLVFVVDQIEPYAAEQHEHVVSVCATCAEREEEVAA